MEEILLQIQVLMGLQHWRFVACQVTDVHSSSLKALVRAWKGVEYRSTWSWAQQDVAPCQFSQRSSGCRRLAGTRKQSWVFKSKWAINQAGKYEGESRWSPGIDCTAKKEAGANPALPVTQSLLCRWSGVWKTNPSCPSQNQAVLYPTEWQKANGWPSFNWQCFD